mmetsp:Transcript_7810/g.23506  ORF Transcript_7810/g.23506 Transcript_7810/m.23506 type:complete len:162 (-) Transcript_7810:407-892(-)
MDGVTWTQLPPVDDILTKKFDEWQRSLFEKGQSFTPLRGGNADHKYQFMTKTGPPATEGGDPTDEQKELTEEERLAWMVHEVDTACSVVPAGAYVLLSTQQVVANDFYKGLSISESLMLDSYLHLRKPVRLESKPVSERAGLAKSTRFLDSVADDLPKGSW